AEVALLAGDMERAHAVATQAVERTRLHGERSIEAYASWLLATIQNTRAIDVGSVAGMFQHAVSIATELGLRPLLAHCELGLADLHERIDSPADADAHR